jgi:vacuolar-type H+-ATPase subunit H
MFQMVGTVAENIPGTNIVTSVLEHPSAFDAAAFYAEKTGKELRVAQTNPVTGGVDPETIAALVDENTTLLSVMYASNITGAIYNIEEIVRQANREADAIREKAARDIEREKKKALNDAKDEISSIALEIAGKVVGEAMDGEQQQRLVDKFLADLEEQV